MSNNYQESLSSTARKIWVGAAIAAYWTREFLIAANLVVAAVQLHVDETNIQKPTVANMIVGASNKSDPANLVRLATFPGTWLADKVAGRSDPVRSNPATAKPKPTGPYVA